MSKQQDNLRIACLAFYVTVFNTDVVKNILKLGKKTFLIAKLSLGFRKVKDKIAICCKKKPREIFKKSDYEHSMQIRIHKRKTIFLTVEINEQKTCTV